MPHVFIYLTLKDSGKPVLINLAHIESFLSENGGTTVNFAGDWIRVKESLQEIDSMINQK